MQQSEPLGRLGEASSSLVQLRAQLADTYSTIEQRIDRLTGELEEAHSERRNELAEKERLADRLQSLLNALPAAVLVLDGKGRVQELNPAAVVLLGDSLAGQLWRELIDELFIAQTEPAGELLLRNGRYVTLSTCPLGSEPGQIVMLQDVTEPRQLRHHLEHSRRLADMGRMAASLAHQIRTPLASAMLYLSQLNGMRDNSELQQRFSGKALASLRGLERLIADMLLFANGGRAERSRVAARQVLLQAIEPCQNRIKMQGIELMLDTDNSECELMVNTPMLCSAVQNLINNALDAMPQEGTLTLSLHAGDGVVELGVRDSGAGIEPALLSQLFEPFVTHRAGGTGLGLAVVQAVARAMGGEVRVESTPGQGSYFAIRLPQAEEGRLAQLA
ncbi:MAG: ATP-binding protein [Chromatiales bacterium]|nr:ATP-binding protein [Chromatiales bacterium]